METNQQQASKDDSNSAAVAAPSTTVDPNSRDIKRYKTRSKTDDSVLANLMMNETISDNNKSNEIDNGEVVIMSIQERYFFS